jgi:hypothetical protein
MNHPVVLAIHPRCTPAVVLPQWVHEIKLDGYRMAARIDNVPIPTKPPVYNGMIAPRDSWMMPPLYNEMIPPGAPRALA